MFASYYPRFAYILVYIIVAQLFFYFMRPSLLLTAPFSL